VGILLRKISDKPYEKEGPCCEKRPENSGPGAGDNQRVIETERVTNKCPKKDY
jgi:hypothetical protein